MDKVHAILIDKAGYGLGYYNVVENPPILQKGQRLIYEKIGRARSMVRPRWIGSDWKENATVQELEKAHSVRQADAIIHIDINENDNLSKAFTEEEKTRQESTDQALLELSLLLDGQKMEWTKESGLVKLWAKYVQKNTYQVDQVPDLGNLKDAVVRLMTS